MNIIGFSISSRKKLIENWESNYVTWFSRKIEKNIDPRTWLRDAKMFYLMLGLFPESGVVGILCEERPLGHILFHSAADGGNLWVMEYMLKQTHGRRGESNCSP